MIYGQIKLQKNNIDNTNNSQETVVVVVMLFYYAEKSILILYKNDSHEYWNILLIKDWKISI